ncbi:MAG TPA: hypothetical protein VN842_04655 [Thermoplasmata archaeon]|nr:hypothetical protein [Thermoplasmata archaeon]
MQVLASSQSGAPAIAVFAFSSGSWSSGGQVTATSVQIIELELGNSNLQHAGDVLVLLVPSSSGSTSIALP